MSRLFYLKINLTVVCYFRSVPRREEITIQGWPGYSGTTSRGTGQKKLLSVSSSFFLIQSFVLDLLYIALLILYFRVLSLLTRNSFQFNPKLRK